MKSKNVIDDFFDDIDSEEKAYLLGFFIADGCISLNNKCKNSYRFGVKLQECDFDIIKMFCDNICPNNKISYKPGYIDKNNVSHKGSYQIRWTSTHMKNTLEKYNVNQRKTYDLKFKFPFNIIKDEFKWDFIRGFFDGDGGVSYSNITNKITFSFYSTSYDFLSQIGDIFESEFEVKKIIDATKKSNMILYNLRFNSNYRLKNFLYKLFVKFYKNKSLFLYRKQHKILEYLLFKYRDNPEDCERLLDIVTRRS